MREIHTKKVYRHFKGNYYYIEEIAKSSETKEELVVYRALYGEDKTLWVRPLQMFLEEVDTQRPGNVTGQSYRFEEVEEIGKDHVN